MQFLSALVRGPKAFEQERRQLREEFAASGAHTMIISEEGLSDFGTTRRRQRLAEAKCLADEFDIHVVCMLRRQDTFVESLWNQEAKNGHEQMHVDGFTRAAMLSDRLDYLTILDVWAGFASVTAIGYEQACARGLVESFNAATGLGLPVETRRRNVSPDMRTAAIMAALNRQRVPHDWRLIDATLEGPRRRHALGTKLRAEVLARFAAQNAELARRFGVHFPDDMPEEPDDPLPEPCETTLTRFQRPEQTL